MHERIIISWPRVIQLLRERGLSQKKLAEHFCINQSTICRLADDGAPEPRYSIGSGLIAMAGGIDALLSGGVATVCAEIPSADRSFSATDSAAQGVA